MANHDDDVPMSMKKGAFSNHLRVLMTRTVTEYSSYCARKRSWRISNTVPVPIPLNQSQVLILQGKHPFRNRSVSSLECYGWISSHTVKLPPNNNELVIIEQVDHRTVNSVKHQQQQHQKKYTTCREVQQLLSQQ